MRLFQLTDRVCPEAAEGCGPPPSLGIAPEAVLIGERPSKGEMQKRRRYARRRFWRLGYSDS